MYLEGTDSYITSIRIFLGGIRSIDQIKCQTGSVEKQEIDVKHELVRTGALNLYQFLTGATIRAGPKLICHKGLL